MFLTKSQPWVYYLTIIEWGWVWYEELYRSRRVLLFIQNISRALRRTKFALLSSLTNCKVDNIQQFPLQILINHAKLENKWNFDLSGFMLVFTVFIIQFLPRSMFQNLQSAIFALSGSAVPRPLLRDVNRPIIFLLWRQSSNNFSVIGWLTSIVQ